MLNREARRVMRTYTTRFFIVSRFLPRPAAPWPSTTGGGRAASASAALSGVGLLGFVVEAVGVRSSVHFGVYAYTEVLRPQLLGVPVVMGPAWIVLVAFANDAAGRLGLRHRPAVVFAALLTTAVDLVIDPLTANQLG